MVDSWPIYYNTLEIHRNFKIYSKKAFLLELNYHKLCSSSKNEFLILYKVDLAEPEIQLLLGTLTLRYVHLKQRFFVLELKLQRICASEAYHLVGKEK
jgi:hypothetical protein